MFIMDRTMEVPLVLIERLRGIEITLSDWRTEIWEVSSFIMAWSREKREEKF